MMMESDMSAAYREYLGFNLKTMWAASEVMPVRVEAVSPDWRRARVVLALPSVRYAAPQHLQLLADGSPLAMVALTHAEVRDGEVGLEPGPVRVEIVFDSVPGQAPAVALVGESRRIVHPNSVGQSVCWATGWTRESTVGGTCLPGLWNLLALVPGTYTLAAGQALNIAAANWWARQSRFSLPLAEPVDVPGVREQVLRRAEELAL
jgi:hypothetical protein